MTRTSRNFFTMDPNEHKYIRVQKVINGTLYSWNLYVPIQFDYTYEHASSYAALIKLLDKLKITDMQPHH